MRYRYSEPLGFPRGSIRAVLAILLTMATICLAFAGQLTNAHDLVVLTASVVAFYFGTSPARTPSVTGLTVTSSGPTATGASSHG